MSVEQPFHFLRITADPGCTMKCIYCNPEGIFNPLMMPTDEVVDTVRAGVELNIRTTHLTGGEPSRRKDIVELVAGIKQAGIGTIEMTTNGIPFYRLAEGLANAGLTGTNISLDTFDPLKFEAITGVDGLSYVLEAIEKARHLFPGKVAINMVVTSMNLDEIRHFVEFFQEKGVMPRFCELTPHGPYMVSSPHLFDENHIPKSEILGSLAGIGNLDPLVKDTIDRQNAHSEYYHLGGDDFTIGIIAPYSNGWPCTGTACTRLRVGPVSANSCVIYPERNLLGLSYGERKEVLMQLVQERRRQMEESLFPERHEPEYNRYRFGLTG